MLSVGFALPGNSLEARKKNQETIYCVPSRWVECEVVSKDELIEARYDLTDEARHEFDSVPQKAIRCVHRWAAKKSGYITGFPLFIEKDSGKKMVVACVKNNSGVKPKSVGMGDLLSSIGVPSARLEAEYRGNLLTAFRAARLWARDHGYEWGIPVCEHDEGRTHLMVFEPNQVAHTRVHMSWFGSEDYLLRLHEDPKFLISSIQTFVKANLLFEYGLSLKLVPKQGLKVSKARPENAEGEIKNDLDSPVEITATGAIAIPGSLKPGESLFVNNVKELLETGRAEYGIETIPGALAIKASSKWTDQKPAHSEIDGKTYGITPQQDSTVWRYQCSGNNSLGLVRLRIRD